MAGGLAPERQFVRQAHLSAYGRDPQDGVARRRWAAILLSFFCFVYGAAFALFAPQLLPILGVPPVVLLAIVIWALPTLPRAPLAPMVLLFFAFFIALVLWPNYLAIALPGMPWITMVRLTGFPMIATLLASLSVSPDFRKTMAAALSSTPLMWKLLVGVILIQFISISFSHQHFQSIDKFILAQTSWTAIFFASVYIFQRPGRVEFWAALLWAMSLLVGLDVLVEHHLSHVPWEGHIPGFLKIENPDVQRMLAGQVRSATGEYRVQGPFTTSVGLAEFCALTVPFIIQFMVGQYKSAVRWAAAASIPFLIFIVILTDSRLGAIGCLLSVMFYLLASSAARWRVNRGSVWGPAITLAYPVLFAGMVALTFVSGRLHARFWGNGVQQASNESRQEQIHMGMPMIWHHPWGHGIGMGAQTLGYIGGDDVLTIDNDYLRIALEYGVVGFIVYYAMFLTAIGYAAKYVLSPVKTSRDYTFLVPIAISITNFFIIKSVFSQQDNDPLVFMMMGMITAMTYRIAKEQRSTAPAPVLASRTTPSPALRRPPSPGLSSARVSYD